MATTADLKNGLCINFNHDIYTVVSFQHVKPGKGPAFVRTRLKSLTNGRVLENTFSAGHEIDITRIIRRPYQFLYKEGEDYVFMQQETFEQITVPKEHIENPDMYLDGQEVEIVIQEETDQILTVELPPFVIMEVTYTEPGIKGDTATNTLKPATVESGAEIRVPLFVNQGDRIKIDTRDRSYVERAK
ncbi:MAG: elongation factor P [Bacteroidales bacterium]|jgi:elongation factor P|nr:elongation factor P [Bacteroidales bacterium]MBP5367193.1 elongation factor P [Bacteroidales bacterium]MBQ1884061.1 elongation factor P [Bacteroidales bacterium]MBR6177996.1 elongation factor P [Bacteroidales bacterium]